MVSWNSRGIGKADGVEEAIPNRVLCKHGIGYFDQRPCGFFPTLDGESRLSPDPKGL